MSTIEIIQDEDIDNDKIKIIHHINEE